MNLFHINRRFDFSQAVLVSGSEKVVETNNATIFVPYQPILGYLSLHKRTKY